MSRYRVVAQNSGRFYVVDNLSMTRVIGLTVYGGRLIESEAEIIAFALNAVAEGYQLGELDNEGTVAFLYDGPTEGVYNHHVTRP